MKKVTQKKKMSIEDLAGSMNRGLTRVRNSIENSIENLIEKKIDALAASTAKGFADTPTKAELKELETRMEAKMATKTDIEGLKGQIEQVNNRLDDISVNRVKYDDHNKLKVRVDHIEEKLGMKK